MYEDQAEGFAELLAVSGVDLTLNGETVRALVARDGNEAQKFDLDPGDCQTVTVSVLKSALPSMPKVGRIFKDDEGGRYRIKARRPNPGRPVAKFVCEYAVDE